MEKMRRIYVSNQETDDKLNELRFLLQETDKSKIIRSLIADKYELAKKKKE